MRENNLEEVMNDPSRIFNGDETGFQICPSTGHVLAEKEAKNVYSIDKGSSKKNITVMFSFSANGKKCCPMIVYPYKRIPEKIAQSVPTEWGIARSDRGWMMCKVFYEYIVNIFYPFLYSQVVIFPVVLFVDGHKSHFTYQLIVLYNKLNIEIIALYPNATRILQPADVAVFCPVKMYWRKAVRDWHAKHPGEVLNKVTFAPLLREVIDFAAKPEILVKGFQACGLNPLNANAVDYTKCLGENTTRPTNEKIGRQDPSTIQYNEDASMVYTTFVNIVGKENVEKFRRINDIISQENNEEFFTVLRLWEYFQENRDHTMILSDESRISMGNDCGQACDQPSTTTGGILETTELTPNETAIFTADQFVTVQNSSLNSHKIGDDHEMYAVQSTSSASSKVSCVVKVVQTEGMKEFLVWPDTPKHKGKRQMERQPYTITSRRYQEVFEKKKLAKHRAEGEKEARKRKCIKAKEKKDKLVPGVTTVKRKLFTKIGVDSSCSSYHKTITSESGRGLCCDGCNNTFYEKCIPKYHKEHNPISEDVDEFLCHMCYKLKPSESSRPSNEKLEEEESEYDDDMHELFSLANKHK